MADFGSGGLTTAGSTTLPIAALVGTAAVAPRIREIGISNTSTTTAVALKLVRLTTAGTPGANLVEASLNPGNPETAVATCVGTYTGTAPTLGNDLGYRAVIGPLGGVVWTWEDYVFTVTAAANAAVAIIVENGTGQACQVYFRWTE
jgi:hypothetical protein